MTALQNLIVLCSKKMPAFAGLVIVFGLSIFLLTRLSQDFAAVTNGHEPFDMQNALSLEDLTSQLADYSPASFSTYWLFTATDFVFPFAGGIFIAAITAFALRQIAPTFYEALLARRGLLLMLAPTVCDWLENLSIVLVLTTHPNSPAGLLSSVLVFKAFKLTTLMIAQTLMALLLVSVGVRWTLDLFKKQP